MTNANTASETITTAAPLKIHVTLPPRLSAALNVVAPIDGQTCEEYLMGALVDGVRADMEGLLILRSDEQIEANLLEA